MWNRVVMVLSVGLMLSGCARVAESRLNPLNWFGRGERVETLTEGALPETIDGRPLMAQVTSLRIDRTPGGAIVRVVGVPPVQGYFDGGLLSATADRPVDGVLEYRLVANPPLRPGRSSTTRSREIVVGLFLSSQTLEGVREIRVVAAENALRARR